MRARSGSGKRFDLVDHREFGFRIRAGEWSASWRLSTRLHNGKRSRIKLGVWPAMGISDARKAAQAKKLEVSKGLDPNDAKRETVRKAVLAAAARRTMGDVLDQYRKIELVQLRLGDGVRRALNGASGVLRALTDREITSIVRAGVADDVHKRAIKSPIAASRGFAHARAFFNCCVLGEIRSTSPAAANCRRTYGLKRYPGFLTRSRMLPSVRSPMQQ